MECKVNRNNTTLNACLTAINSTYTMLYLHGMIMNYVHDEFEMC